MKFTPYTLLIAAVAAIGLTTQVANAQSDGKPKGNEIPKEEKQGPQVKVPKIEVPANLKDKLPAALQAQLTSYRELSKTFIDQQRALTAGIRTATEEERNTVRTQLKANRERFLTDTKQVRTDIRDQLKEVRQAAKERQGTPKTPGEGRGRSGNRPWG